MHTEKGAQHGNRVVAPQSAVTPNDILWNPDNPAWDPGITRIDELPPPPNFFSGSWPNFIGTIGAIPAEFVFVSIVTFTGVERLILHVLSDIGFECLVLLRS
jgi:hypothetical protein